MSLRSKVVGCLLLAVILFATGSCAKNRKYSDYEERGMFSQKLYIRTLPTKAKIFINEKEIGTSPLTYYIRHEERRMYNIKAVPIYPNQYTQNIFLMVPPVPKTMTIYMNHYPEDYDREKDKPFTPPEKPKPEIIVKTEIDTVIIEKHTREFLHYALPVVYFATDSFSIDKNQEEKLQPLVELLKKEQDLFVDIYGFADPRASDKHNITLSLNRANSTKEYLVKNGINPNRIATFGHGKISKVDAGGVELDYAENRKVIFLIRRNEK